MTNSSVSIESILAFNLSYCLSLDTSPAAFAFDQQLIAPQAVITASFILERYPSTAPAQVA